MKGFFCGLKVNLLLALGVNILSLLETLSVIIYLVFSLLFEAISSFPLYLFCYGLALLRPQQKRMSFQSGLGYLPEFHFLSQNQPLVCHFVGIRIRIFPYYKSKPNRFSKPVRFVLTCRKTMFRRLTFYTSYLQNKRTIANKSVHL